MFAQDPFNHTNVNSLLSSSSRVFNAQVRVGNVPKNIITTSFSKGGAYANKQRYSVQYALPFKDIGNGVILQGRGANSLNQAIADAKSGNNSKSQEFVIESYWYKDRATAVANGAPAGKAKDQPSLNPVPKPALPTPIMVENDDGDDVPTPNEDNTDTETDDTSDDPNAQEDSTESGEDISTLSDVPEEVEIETETRPAFILLPIIALAGIGYYTYSESKKK